MIGFKKPLSLAALVLPLAVAAASPALATKCRFEGDKLFKGTRKYEDTGLWEDYLKRGGSAETSTRKFFLINGEDKNINEIRMAVYKGGNTSDSNLVAKKTRSENITKTEVRDFQGLFVDHVKNRPNTIAIFNVPWEDGFEVHFQVKWSGDTHWKSFNEKEEGEYVPFVFPVVDGEVINGIWAKRNSWGLGLVPLHDCH
ncbi:hypothetical protein [Pseudoruegeria sp. HB172150]|uniref:hypothetical protein n=1 Tax=Pseudoruegeria sp. HB172150 TaxID=2721164 RepID=UPI00155642F4|nr:hypothetical protein [Pseudoruegeria sp. HB172150]